jgi:hypothetical protein
VNCAANKIERHRCRCIQRRNDCQSKSIINAAAHKPTLPGSGTAIASTLIVGCTDGAPAVREVNK